MRLIPPKAVGVAEFGGSSRILGEFRKREGGTSARQGRGPAPPALEAVREKFGLSWWKATRRTT